MQVILSGSLRHFPPAELLPFLSSRSTGWTCDFEGTGRRTRVFFDRETIAWAESSRGGDVSEAVLELFEWPNGTFTVLDSVTLPEGVKPVALEVGALVEEARRRAKLAGGYKDGATFRVVDDPLQQQLNLTTDDLKLLFRLTSARPFKDLVSELGMPRAELTEKLQRLEQLGLVIREDPQTTQVPAGKKKTKTVLVGSLTPDTAPDSVFPLLDAEHTIGRLPANAITIADPSVSSNHARILRTDEGFVLEDLQSRNGSFVNGEKIEGKRLLADGDLVRLGKVIMTFNVAKEGRASDTTTPEAKFV